MVVCCVQGCLSDSEDRKPGVYFYPFPLDPKKRQQWLTILPIHGIYLRTAKVCSLHFARNQFSSFRPHRLLYDATPFHKKDSQSDDGKNKEINIEFKEMQRDKWFYTCEICHQRFVHENKLNEHTLYSHKCSNSETEGGNSNALIKENSPAWMQYECTTCKKLFEFFKEAMAHVRIVHSSNGVTNPQCIKRIPVEKCYLCPAMVKSLLVHTCLNEEKMPTVKKPFVCMLCSSVYGNIRVFNNHVYLIHNKDVDKLYFPDIKELLNWKRDMERETLLNYSMVEEWVDKKIYHCKHDSDSGQRKLAFCPSLIVAQEFENGIRVDHYKDQTHHQSLHNYKLPANYKKYEVTQFLKATEKEKLRVINDEYLQFKLLLDNILLESAKLNSAALKVLMGKALDMTAILANYDEDIEEGPAKTDLSEALDKKQTLTTDEEPAKKPKLDNMSPKIISTFSLATEPVISGKESDKKSEVNDIDDAILKSNRINKKNFTEIQNDDNGSDTEGQESKPDRKEVLTFNDTYKDFVSKSFVSKARPCSRKAGLSNADSPVVKTFQESSPLDTKSIENNCAHMESPVRRKSKIFNNNDRLIENTDIFTSDVVIKTEDTSDTDEILNNNKFEDYKPTTVEASSPVSSITNGSVTAPVNVKTENSDSIKIVLKRKSVTKGKSKVRKTVKTKIGQFNPLKSVKVERQKGQKLKTLNFTNKVDVNYKVIEQEEDCNILVLKL